MPPRNRAANETSRPKVRAARATTRKPSITIIGAGRLGAALALALEQSGYQIDALVATTRAHARRAARLLCARPLVLAASELNQLPDSGLLIIATPDDRVAATAARLAAALRPAANGGHAEQLTRNTRRQTCVAQEERRAESKTARVVLHVSGVLSSRELKPLSARGLSVGSLHPLVSVSDPRANARDFAGAYFCVEGDARAARAARSLVRALGGRAFTVAARDKSLYHAAAVTASGHLVALFDLATALLVRCGLKHVEARRVLLPLARGTISNLSHARENAQALTGPFARADAATIRRHLAALAAVADAEDALVPYALLGLRSLRLAAERGGDDGDKSRRAEIARGLAPFAKRRR